MTHVKHNRSDFSGMIALAHLTSLCSTSLPSPENCIPGNVCCALFPLTLVSFKGEHYSFAKKSFPPFVMNSDFITFDLKLSFLPSILLITTISKFKAISGGPQLGSY